MAMRQRLLELGALEDVPSDVISGREIGDPCVFLFCKLVGLVESRHSKKESLDFVLFMTERRALVLHSKSRHSPHEMSLEKLRERRSSR